MKNKKGLIIGIIAAVVVLLAALALVLTQCTGGTPAATGAPTSTGSDQAETYDIYWNLDMEEYAGKSEAGMSSRMPESDGYFHVRFFHEGEIVTLKVAERKLINAIDYEEVMGLEIDEDGLVTGVKLLSQLPLEQVGWRFYVQSAARTVIKLNSSVNFKGMEVMLEGFDPDRVWDMTGKSGDKGCVTEAMKMDKVMVIADLDGNITHIFIYERPNYMLYHDGFCEHCNETVSWGEWTREDAMPIDSGHYQLQADIKTKSQTSISEDAKICLDLNGYRIDGAANSRVIIMNKPGIEMAIMDTSDDKTGTIAARGAGNMGMAIMVKYGALTIRGGTIDASDVVNTSGGAVSVSKGQFLYMYGGKIIGGEAECKRNATTGAFESGAGGSVYVSGKFVMHDGIIENGSATSIVTRKNGTKTYNRGLGGNVYLASGSEFEMNGGTIRGGKAGSYGGNIAADGTATMTINGGTISGGYVSGDGRMGGNIYGSSKVSITINGGTISGGKTRGHSGNIYSSGTLTINGGSIRGGVAYDAATGKLKDTANHHNIYVVNGKLRIRGGYIQGGLSVTDTSDTDAKTATVGISGSTQITDGPNGYDLTISNNRVVVTIDKLTDKAKIGVNVKHGLFTKPTDEANTDNFYSNIDQAEVIYFDGRLGLGRVNCLCGKETHALGCDGTVLFWMPNTSATALPTTTGNYYLTQDVNTTKGYVVSASNDVKLDFNGHNITFNVPSSATSGFRLYRSDNNSRMTLTDTTDAPGTMKTIMPAAGTKYTGKQIGELAPGSAEEQAEAERLWAQADYGALLWARGGEINILAGNFDGSNVTGTREQGGMVIYVAGSTSTDATTGTGTTYGATMNIYGGTILGGNIGTSGNVAVKSGGVLNMYGGTIVGGKANKGGAMYVEGTANIYGGTIRGGSSATPTGTAADGGNIYISMAGVLNVKGGTITGGKADIGGNIFAYGTLNVTGGVIEKGEASKCGGNVGTNSQRANITLGGNAIIRDGYGLRGGNVALYVRGNQGFTICDDVQILNGEGKEAGGNILVATWLDEPGNLLLTGGTVSGGKAPMGGNVYVAGSSSASHATFTATGGTIKDGDSAEGANIAVGFSTATVTLNGATVHNTKSGSANILVKEGVLNIGEGTTISNEAAAGTNVRTSADSNTVSRIVMTGGTISGGKNSNVRLYGRDTFDMSGGIVTGGSASNGGNFYVEGNGGALAVLTVTGGTIEKGTTTNSKTGANVRLNNGSSQLIVDGATIPGGIHANSTATVTLKNNVTIDKGDSDCTYSIRMGANARLLLDELTGGKVYVTTDVGNTVAENVSGDAVLSYVLSEVVSGGNTVALSWDEATKVVVLGKAPNSYCSCGATKNSYACHCASADKAEMSWLPWNGTDALPTTEGNYYLTGDVDLTAETVAAPENGAVIRIDLRGHRIILENAEDIYNFTGVTGVRLVITDSTATPGSVVLTGTDTVTGGILKLTSGNTFVLYRATMDVSGFQVGELDGGLAYITTGATFEVYSGALVGNAAGRMLHVNGTANLYGGTLSGAKVNIRLNNTAAKVKLEGVTITNAVASGTNVRVDIGEVTIANGTTITNTATGATNVITTNSNVSSIIMTGGTISGGTNSNVRLMNGDSFLMSGGTITGGTAANGGNIYVEGTTGAESVLTITGGTIENGTTTGTRTGANIRLNNGSSHLVVDGATIPGGIHANSTATVTLKNVVNINKGDSAYDYSLRMGNSAKLIVTEMTGGEVYIYTDNDGKVIADDVATDLSAFFGCDRSGYSIIYSGTTLVHKKN